MEDPHQALCEEWTNKVDWYVYKSRTASTNASVLQSYIHMLDLANASSVLEVGCGSGNGIPIILENLSPSAAITATDLTPALLEIARSANNPRTTILEANSEFLPFEDESFDRYIANMSLMIVHSPENMLKEAYRVVKKGSICGFSVWGSVEKSNVITISAAPLESLGIQFENNSRSNFHLNDKTKLRGMFLEAGFSKVYMCENVHPYPSFDPTEIVEHYNASNFLSFLEGTPKFEQACEAIREAISKLFDDGGVLTLATLIVIAIK